MSTNDNRDLIEQIRTGAKPTARLRQVLNRIVANAPTDRPWRAPLRSRLLGTDGKLKTGARLARPIRSRPPEILSWRSIMQRSANSPPGYVPAFSPEDTPVFGAQQGTGDWPVSSVLVKPATGEFSMVSVLGSDDSPLGAGYSGGDVPPFFEGRTLTGSMSVLYYDADLPSQNCEELTASVTLTVEQPELNECFFITCGNDPEYPSAVALYGHLTVTLFAGQFEKTNTVASNWAEFIRIENVQGNLISELYSFYDGSGKPAPLTLNVSVPYDQKSTLFVVQASIDIDSLIVHRGKTELVVCDFRFPDDDSLRAYDDTTYEDPNNYFDPWPAPAPLQISEISLAGGYRGGRGAS